MERVLNCGKQDYGYSLSKCCERYLGVTLDKTVRNKFIGLTGQPYTVDQISYGANDVVYLIDIREKQMAKLHTTNGESIINHLRTILEMIAYCFVMSLMVIGFGLMMFSALIVGSIQDCYDYCCRIKFQSKVLSYLTKCWVLLNVGIKKLKKLLSGLKNHLS